MDGSNTCFVNIVILCPGTSFPYPSQPVNVESVQILLPTSAFQGYAGDRPCSTKLLLVIRHAIVASIITSMFICIRLPDLCRPEPASLGSILGSTLTKDHHEKVDG